ncbi:MAG: DUF2530 domain-containing protein [Micropruina sp.]|nr:DUF2530 domain-containing protein [Micropruina sp.]
MTQDSPRKPDQVFLQAPVRALDPHGVQVVSIGTAAFAASSVLLWLTRESLAAIDKSWWLQVAITGTGIGLLALGYLLLRRKRGVSDNPPT